MSPPTRRRLLFALQATASLVLLALIAWRTDLSAAAAALWSIRPSALVAALAALVLQTYLCACRWVMIVRRTHSGVDAVGAFGAIYVSLLLNQCFPPNIGADAYRTYWLHREGTPLASALRSVLIDRLSGLSAVVAMLAAGLPFLAARLPPEVHMGLVLVLVVSALATSIFLYFDRLPWLERLPRPAMQLATLAESARAVLLHGPGGATIAAMAVVIQALSAVALTFLAWGIGIGLTLADCLLVVPAVTLLMTVPISLGGWGVREGLLVAAVSSFGVAAAHGLALSIALGATVLLNALFGALPLLLGRGRFTLPSPRADAGGAGGEG